MSMHFSNKAGVKGGYTNMMHSYNLIDDHCPLLMLGKIAFLEAKRKKWHDHTNMVPPMQWIASRLIDWKGNTTAVRPVPNPLSSGENGKSDAETVAVFKRMFWMESQPSPSVIPHSLLGKIKRAHFFPELTGSEAVHSDAKYDSAMDKW